MIKINLANTLINKSESPSVPSTGTIKDLVVRLILIMIPVIGIIVYEKNDITAKNEKVTRMTEEQAQLGAQLAKVGTIDDIVKQKNELKADLNAKFDVMKKIFGLRSQKIQTLTILQKHIPPNCWLKKIRFSEKTVTVSGISSQVDSAQGYISELAGEKDLFSKLTGQDVGEDKDEKGLYRFDFSLELKE